ncbi:MAG: DivIVA domain-containing protein [Bdellovibrionaceae bacterium]|nr:DivIVA domain-containing protein [Pseudobdellovibrionaceae bacterium]
MKITPIDIIHKSFSKKMMGVDSAEVMEFLAQIASQMELLLQERNSMREAMREKELSLMEYKDRDQVLKNTITTASQMTERLRQDADREAKLIIADANQKAEIIMRDSRDSLKKMYQEITDLKRARMQFEANLKALVQAHLSLVEQGEKYMPQMHLPNYNMVTNQNQNDKSSSVSPLASE